MDNQIESYKQYLNSKKLSDNTVSSYIYDINNFDIYVKTEYEMDIQNIRKAQILTYLVNLQKLGKSSSTISRTISSLKGFYEYLRKERLISENPSMSIHSPKQIKKIPSIMTEPEIDQIMRLPDVSTFKGARDSAILELLYSSGIKVTELISIKLKDVMFSIEIIRIMGSKERIVPLSQSSHNAIYNYMTNFRSMKSKDDNEYLFVNISGEPVSRQGIWKILKFYEKKIDLNKELSPQILRNSFAVHLLTHGADLRTVQELMGHTSLTATQNYLQNIEFKSLEVFKKTFPRT